MGRQPDAAPWRQNRSDHPVPAPAGHALLPACRSRAHDPAKLGGDVLSLPQLGLEVDRRAGLRSNHHAALDPALAHVGYGPLDVVWPAALRPGSLGHRGTTLRRLARALFVSPAPDERPKAGIIRRLLPPVRRPT